MKIRLLKSTDNNLKLLYQDGTMTDATDSLLIDLLRNFNNSKNLSNGEKIWAEEYADASLYPGETLAFVSDSNELVINNFFPFDFIFQIQAVNVNDFLSVEEYSKAVGKSVEQVKVHLRNGRIPNAKKIGRNWVIAKDSVNKYPLDNRISRGKFIK